MGRNIAAIGKLDRRITIEQQTTGQDSYGQIKPTWSELATVWAGIMIKPTPERVEDSQRVARQGVTFQIRYRSDVNERMRVVYNSKNYYIKATEEKSRERRLDLICELKDNA